MSTKVESVKPIAKQTTSSSRAIQNYSKILQNFSSNPICHHQRTRSEFVNLGRKPSQDFSTLNQSKLNSSKAPEQASR